MGRGSGPASPQKQLLLHSLSFISGGDGLASSQISWFNCAPEPESYSWGVAHHPTFARGVEAGGPSTSFCLALLHTTLLVCKKQMKLEFEEFPKIQIVRFYLTLKCRLASFTLRESD